MSTTTSRPRPTRARQEHQLPAGRHGLTREYVHENQRTRIIDATISVLGVAGINAMSVEDIIATAGVSRRTFYDHFKGKNDVFLQASTLVNRELEQAITDPLAGGDLTAALAAAIDLFVEKPAYADIALVEVLAAGDRSMTAYEQRLDALAATIASHRPKMPWVHVRLLVGGIADVLRGHALASSMPAARLQVPALTDVFGS